MGQRGFSLVELLVALVVGLLVTLGAGQLFLSSLNSYQAVTHISRNQEVVVFVVNIMIRHIREEDKPANDFELMPADNGTTCDLFLNNELLVGGLYKAEDGSGCDYFVPDGTEPQPCDGITGCNFFTLKLPRLDPQDGEPEYEEISFHIMERQP